MKENYTSQPTPKGMERYVKGFINVFAKDGMEAQSQAMTYLALLAVAGSDRDIKKVMPGQEARLSYFRGKALLFRFVNEKGLTENQAALAQCMSDNAGYKREMEVVKARISFAATISHHPGDGLSVSQMLQKQAALRRGDLKALSELVVKGIVFDEKDLKNAISNRHPETRYAMVRIICESGVACPNWLRPSIKDPALLKIIDSYAVIMRDSPARSRG